MDRESRIFVRALFAVAFSGLLHAQTTEVVPIGQEAVATLRVAGFVDFLVADGEAVWATNQGRIEKLQRDQPRPVSPVSVPVGPTPRFLAAGEGAVWTLNQGDGSVSRIDPVSNSVAATIATNVPGLGGDITTGVGQDREWLKGVKRRVERS